LQVVGACKLYGSVLCMCLCMCAPMSSNEDSGRKARLKTKFSPCSASPGPRSLCLSPASDRLACVPQVYLVLEFRRWQDLRENLILEVCVDFSTFGPTTGLNSLSLRNQGYKIHLGTTCEVYPAIEFPKNGELDPKSAFSMVAGVGRANDIITFP
jgi:hypothetical protein